MRHETIPVRCGEWSATLTTYLLDNYEEIDPGRTRPCVLILPGGAYRFTSRREAEPLAVQMNAMGLHACVLHYSCRPAPYWSALQQAARAVALIRENAAAWNVNPGAVAVLGCSAGGHLAAGLGVYADTEPLRTLAANWGHSPRPDGLLLCYPVIRLGGLFDVPGMAIDESGLPPDIAHVQRLDAAVHGGVPPCFLWHTFEDRTVPVQNSLLFCTALAAAGVSFELHVYPRGVHGLSLGTEETVSRKTGLGVQREVQGWITLAGEWVRGLV